MPWDPAQYARFAGHRLRPALDLLARVDAEAPASVVDLGCGTGNVTRLLAERWPAAAVHGVDSSPEMLGKAADPDRRIDWQQADIAAWTPPAPVDVLFSNAALHWLPDHPRLFERLVGCVSQGGWLAVQMPRNWDAPSHVAVEEIAALPRWRGSLDGVARPTSLAPETYHALLSPRCRALDIWETVYLQALEGEDAVAQWTRGTFLVPFLDALLAGERDAFAAEYRRRMAAAYPRRADGVTLYPFRRLFIVAQR